MNRLKATLSLVRRPVVIGIVAMLLLLPILLAGVNEPPAASAPAPASPYTAVARGRVDVEGGVIQLAAQRDGVVKTVAVEEGDSVRKGQILAILDDGQARLNVALAASERAAASAQMTQFRVERATAAREEQRLEDLLRDDAVARAEWERARDHTLLTDARLRSATAMHAAAQARLRIAEHEVELRAVRAPLDGRIVRRQVRPGDGVSTLNVTPLFWFAPHTPRIVRAELEERFVAAVRPGGWAEVSTETENAKIFRAQVVRIGLLLGAKRAVTDDPYERADVRVVECVLTLETAAQDLLLGQRVLLRFPTTP